MPASGIKYPYFVATGTIRQPEDFQLAIRPITGRTSLFRHNGLNMLAFFMFLDTNQLVSPAQRSALEATTCCEELPAALQHMASRLSMAPETLSRLRNK